MHPHYGRAVLGGLTGTAVMTAIMYLLAPNMGVHADVAALLGSMVGGSWLAGMALHFVNGAIVFPAVYVFALARRLPGSPVARGTLWGIALWVFALVVVFPGAAAASDAGPIQVGIAMLVVHLIYGSVLGAMTGEPQREVAHA